MGKTVRYLGVCLFIYLFIGCRVFSRVTAASLQLLLCLPVRDPESRGRDGREGRHCVLTETERERGERERWGGATWKYNPTDWGRSQANEQARQAG